MTWDLLWPCQAEEGNTLPQALRQAVEIVKSQASFCCVASISTSVNLHPHSQQDESKDTTAKKYGAQKPSIPLPGAGNSIVILLFLPSSCSQSSETIAVGRSKGLLGILKVIKDQDFLLLGVR